MGMLLTGPGLKRVIISVWVICETVSLTVACLRKIRDDSHPHPEKPGRFTFSSMLSSPMSVVREKLAARGVGESDGVIERSLRKQPEGEDFWASGSTSQRAVVDSQRAGATRFC